jgi:hypothetical protein
MNWNIKLNRSAGLHIVGAGDDNFSAVLNKAQHILSVVNYVLYQL